MGFIRVFSGFSITHGNCVSAFQLASYDFLLQNRIATGLAWGKLPKLVSWMHGWMPLDVGCNSCTLCQFHLLLRLVFVRLAATPTLLSFITLCNSLLWVQGKLWTQINGGCKEATAR